jgi:hypothetical protein
MSELVNPVSPFIVNGVELVLGAGLTFLASAYWRWRRKSDAVAAKNAATIKALQEQLTVQQGQLQMLGVAVQPLTAAMASMLVKSLTHYHTPDTDVLLAKVGPPNTLTQEEEEDLRGLMNERSNDRAARISPLERNAAQLLLLIVERNRLEAGNTDELFPVLVGVPKPHELRE